MKKALTLLLTTILWTAPLSAQGVIVIKHHASVAATFTLAHDAVSGLMDCNTTCSALSLGYTATSGSIITVMGFLGANAYANSSPDSSYGTWQFPANCHVYQSSATNGAFCAYVILTASTSTITLGYNVDAAGYWHIRNYTKSSGSITAEAAPTPTTAPSCGTTASPCSAPNVSLTGGGVNEVMVSGAGFGNSICGLKSGSPFGHVLSDTYGDGDADYVNTTSGTGAQFVQGSSCPTQAAAQFEGLSLAFY